MELEYFPKDHIYQLDGVIIPSVTQILARLNNFGFISEERLKEKALFGQYVHIACELWDKNILDMDTVEPTIKERLDGWIKFRKDSGYVPQQAELRMCSERYRFAGRVDSVGTIGKKRVLADIKTGVENALSHPLQTAGYQILYDELYPKEKIQQRMSVYLLEDGTYKLGNKEKETDKIVFFAYLTTFNHEIKGG